MSEMGYAIKNGKLMKLEASSTIGLREMVACVGYVESRTPEEMVEVFDQFEHFDAEIVEE